MKTKELEVMVQRIHGAMLRKDLPQAVEYLNDVCLESMKEGMRRAAEVSKKIDNDCDSEGEQSLSISDITSEILFAAKQLTEKDL